MNEAAMESSPVKMEVTGDVSNGMKEEPADTEEPKKTAPKKRESSEDPKPDKISKKPRKSSSSVSSDKSGSHENGDEQTKRLDPGEDDDFLGWTLPEILDSSHREIFLKFLKNRNIKEDDDAKTEDDAQSVSDTNEESDSAAESISNKSKPSPPKKEAPKDNDFMKPFEFGWVREVVYRSQANPGGKRRADVYYYTPAGKKVRSSQEVSEYITGDLTLDDFSFVMKPVGANDPSKEIVREAGKHSSKVDESSPHQKTTPTSKPKPKSLTESNAKTPSSVKVPMKWPNKKPNPGKKLEFPRKTAGARTDADDSSEDTGWDMVQKMANGIKPRSSDSSVEDEAPKNNVKLKEIPSKYQPNQFFALSEATTMSVFNFFQYLKVHELLRATQVNKTWHLIATHQSLWETVRMKNSKVRDFKGFGDALRKYNTRSLDLRKMITPESPEATNEMWTELGSVISTCPNLKRVDFGRCSPSAIEVVTAKCPHLESITSLSIRGTDLNMSEIANCTNLVELKLKSFGGIEIKNIASLKLLKNLKTLVLTSVKDLEGVENALPESLEALELGECVKLTDRFAVNALPKLTNLKRLRLERGQGSNCPTLAMLHTISTLPNLTQLELINFDIKPGFDKALSKCTNIKVLLIIPTYVTQSATTNHVVMGGVSKLSSSLEYFIWGLTLELLRVTDLFIDQVEGGKAKSGPGVGGKKAGTGDSIPILKPISEEGSDSNREGSASQVDILGLPKLQRVLSTLLPQTKIKILKIPFSATWRQTVTDVQA